MDLLVCHKNSSRLWVFLVSFSFVFFPSLLISQLDIVFLHIGVDLLPFLGELLVKALDEFSHLVSVKANSKKVESEALSLSPVTHKSWQDFLHSSLHEDPTNHSGNSRHVKIEVNVTFFFYGPEALSVSINTFQSLNDDVVFVEILLKCCSIGKWLNQFTITQTWSSVVLLAICFWSFLMALNPWMMTSWDFWSFMSSVRIELVFCNIQYKEEKW